MGGAGQVPAEEVGGRGGAEVGEAVDDAGGDTSVLISFSLIFWTFIFLVQFLSKISLSILTFNKGSNSAFCFFINS